jgi:hypothetical protein
VQSALASDPAQAAALAEKFFGKSGDEDEDADE